MKNTLLCIALASLLSSCTNEDGPFTLRTVSSYEITDCHTTTNGDKFLVYEQNNQVGAFKVTSSQLDSLRELQIFKVEVKEKNGNSTAISIQPATADTTNKKLYYVEANDIEDYKRKASGSYTLIESDGHVPVITPTQEISNMLRLESFRFYYYKNWDGNFYFDHIEEEGTFSN